MCRCVGGCLGVNGGRDGSTQGGEAKKGRGLQLAGADRSRIEGRAITASS